MSSLIKKVFIFVVVMFLLTVAMDMAAAAGSTGTGYHVCKKAVCFKYEANGQPHYNSFYGVKYHAFVANGTKVYGKHLGNGWMQQELFRSQSVYYKSSDFE